MAFERDVLQGAKAACLGVEDSALLDPKASAREERIRMFRDMAIIDKRRSCSVYHSCGYRRGE